MYIVVVLVMEIAMLVNIVKLQYVHHVRLSVTIAMVMVQNVRVVQQTLIVPIQQRESLVHQINQFQILGEL